MYAEHGKHPREALFYAVIMLSYRDTLLDLNCLNTAGIGILIRGVARIFQGGHPVSKWGYRIYSNKRRAAFRGAYFIFRVTSAALIRGRRLFKNCTWQIYFFYIFIQRYTFCLLIFLWTDTKLIVNLELREKFTQWKNPESFMITRAKLSAVRANSFVVVEQFTMFSQFWCHCLRIGARVWRLFEGGAY